MTSITPHYRTVQQLLQSQSFSIDEYQREYKWERKNIEELISDLQSKFDHFYKPGDELRRVSEYGEYFLGSIIISKRNGKNYLIDGQQRVTSLTLLLIYLHREASKKGLSVAGTLAPLMYSDSFGEPKFNLDIPERLPVIRALFRGEPFNAEDKEESVQTMYARFRDIEESDLVAELGEGLPHFAYWLMTRVGLIEISTDNDNHAYAIFETMNDRGKPLSPVDMLKAYLLAPIQDAELRARANREWKKQVLGLISWGGIHEAERDAQCIKAWLRAQHAESTRERRAGAVDRDWELIGTVFHRWTRDNHGRLGLGTEANNAAFICDRFAFFAGAYRKILDASRTYTKGLESVFYNAHNDFTLQSTVLLAPLLETDDEDTVRRKMEVTAAYLDIWIMRRAVNHLRCAYSFALYPMWYLCKEIRRKSLLELVEILNDKLKAEDVTFKGAPSKDRAGLRTFNLNQSSRPYVFHLLARVTAATEVGAGRADPFPALVERQAKNPFDIEHIWPSDYGAVSTFISKPGEFYWRRDLVRALLLLPADVNRSLQDKVFADKRPIYARQNIYAASLDTAAYEHQPQFEQFREKHGLPFEPFEDFTIEEADKRHQLLEKLVELVWSPDRLRAAAGL
jgi:uncharacterized protein with ParB-like and HNH nuclease domain